MLHVVMRGHEHRLSGSMEPVDQLATNVWEPHECLKIVSLAFNEIVKCLVLLLQATCRDNIHPFGQADILETLFHELEQRRSVLLLVHRQVQDNL